MVFYELFKLMAYKDFKFLITCFRILKFNRRASAVICIV